MLNATVVERIDVTPELVRLFVKPDQPFQRFLPGQYVALGLPGNAPRPSHYPPEQDPPQGDKIIKRAYSIGSSPHNSEVLEFYLALLPQGQLTARLASLKKGDRIFAAPKITGTFTLEGVPDHANLVFVATGTGLAPFVAMIKTPETWIPGRKVTLIHGVRYVPDLGYREELHEFAQSNPHFRYEHIVSRATPEWQGHKGYVQKLFTEQIVPLDPARDHVFVCGNPAMIDEIEKSLCANGYSVHSKKNPGNLHLEKYW